LDSFYAIKKGAEIMVIIPQASVYAAYNELGNCCLQCEKCSELCLLKRARGYLLNFTRNGRQIDQGTTNEQFVSDNKPFDKLKLTKALETVEKCCQHCGDNHKDTCFVNNARKALQTLLGGSL
jgi:hypothetical protein